MKKLIFHVLLFVMEPYVTAELWINTDFDQYVILKRNEPLYLECTTSIYNSQENLFWNTSRPREEYADRLSDNIYTNSSGQYTNLTILNAVDEDVGNYTCYNSSQYSARADVIVAPLITNMTDEIGKEFLRVKCNVSSYPAAKVSWNIVYKEISLENNKELYLNKSTGRWTLIEYNGVTNAELFVDNITPYDTGTYECIATNIVTTVSSNHTIEIEATALALTVTLSLTGGILAVATVTVTVKSVTVKAAMTNVYNTVMGKSTTSVLQPPTRGAETFNVVNENANAVSNQTNVTQQTSAENPTQEQQPTEQQGEEEDLDEEECEEEDVEEEEDMEGEECEEVAEQEVEDNDIVQTYTRIRIDFDNEYKTINLISEIILLTILNIRALMQNDASVINYQIFFNLKENFKPFSLVVKLNYELQNVTLRKVFFLLTPDFTIGKWRKEKKEKDLVAKCYEFFNATLKKKQSIHNSAFINSLLPLTVDEIEILWCTTHSKDKLSFGTTEKSAVDQILMNIFQNTATSVKIEHLNVYLGVYSDDLNSFYQRFNILCSYPKEKERALLIQQQLQIQYQGNTDSEKVFKESRKEIKSLLESKKEGFVDETSNILKF